MRMGRLLLLLITFGPCPHQWMLVLGNGEPVVSSSEVTSRKVADRPHCKCCHKPASPPQEQPPIQSACCHRDMSYICEVSVHAPEQAVLGFLAVLDTSLTGVAVNSITCGREPPLTLSSSAVGQCTRLRI